ncbi:TRAP transporter large permease [Oricola sp.]|uniref:TRAP transporter large permease n=1 Tax=Oricola sp. TaxID=1979950 RepID=UPI0025D111A4|nr:TRAP transporter large permease [Oricola sp.]MCI5074143.1 TRAP transporter large permease [Oricola sp.]
MDSPLLWASALLVILLLAATPVAFALLISGMVGLYMTIGFGPLSGALQLGPYESVASFTLTTLPMFVLMAEFLTAGRFTRDIFEAGDKWLRHIRGGMAMAAVGGGTLLAAICGSSSAAAGTLAAAAYPEMKRLGYSDSFATASTAIVGTLAIMIPPSIGFVFYGILTEVSIGKLFLAGLIPGIITGFTFLIVIYLNVRLRPDSAPSVAPAPPIKERVRALLPIWPILGFMVLMFAGLYSGAVTATEIGAVGAFLALVFGVVMRRIGWKEFYGAMAASARNSIMIFTIIIGAGIFGLFLTVSGMTQSLLVMVTEAGLNRWTILLIVVAIWLFLGFFLEQFAIQVLTVPVVVPLLMQLGFDPIWIGVLLVKAGEIGVVTPPMGLNVFVVSSVTKVDVNTVFRGIWPFVLAELVILGLLIAVPQLSLWLPG